MTPTVSPRRRGASLALGGIFVVAGTMLATPTIAFAAPSTEAVNAINDRYSTFGGEGSLLGPAIGEAEDVQGGVKREYQGGTIYYSKDSGAHVMYGQILERYKALGGPTSGLGFPKNDESDTGDGVGRFNDFSAPEGASIYWNPQQGASVLKGKVLEAWRQSGGITGPFGYPSADVSDMGGTLTGKFVGPEGTEIQWSKAAGLVTIPAALAGKIPGFGKEGTTAVSKPNVTTPKVEKEGGFKWWWLIPILALLGLLAFLPRLFKKKPVEVAPVKVAPRAPEVKKVVTPPPPPAPKPVAKPVTPPAPPRRAGPTPLRPLSARSTARRANPNPLDQLLRSPRLGPGRRFRPPRPSSRPTPPRRFRGAAAAKAVRAIAPIRRPRGLRPLANARRAVSRR